MMFIRNALSKLRRQAVNTDDQHVASMTDEEKRRRRRNDYFAMMVQAGATSVNCGSWIVDRTDGIASAVRGYKDSLNVFGVRFEPPNVRLLFTGEGIAAAGKQGEEGLVKVVLGSRDAPGFKYNGTASIEHTNMVQVLLPLHIYTGSLLSRRESSSIGMTHSYGLVILTTLPRRWPC
jgi:hypothetical protein